MAMRPPALGGAGPPSAPPHARAGPAEMAPQFMVEPLEDDRFIREVAPGFPVGARVEAQYRDGRWYHATVSSYESQDGCFTIDWDDGAQFDRIKRRNEMRLASLVRDASPVRLVSPRAPTAPLQAWTYNAAPAPRADGETIFPALPVQQATAFVVPGSAQDMDAVQAYGVQLKSWVDWQVHNLLRQIFPGDPQTLMEDILESRKDCATSRTVWERFERQLFVVAEEQARLSAKVEEDIVALKAHVANQINSNAALWEREGSMFSVQIAELRQRSEVSHSALERLQTECADALRRISGDSVPRKDVDSLMLAVRQVEADLKGHADKVAKPQFDELGIELRRLSDAHGKHRDELNQHREEASRIIDQRLSQMETGLDQRISKIEQLEALRGEVEALFQQIVHRIDAAKREAALRFESFQAIMAEDLATQSNKLLATMRAELTAAFRSEAAAVTALDEKLWLKDQELRQHVDKVASHRTRERIAVIERGDLLNGSPSTEILAGFAGIRSSQKSPHS